MLELAAAEAFAKCRSGTNTGLFAPFGSSTASGAGCACAVTGSNVQMDRHTALDSLRRSQGALRARGVRRAAVFGSVAHFATSFGTSILRPSFQATHVYRHHYEDVAAQMVWDTVKPALPALRIAVASELGRP
jgi:hypothetical protein